MSHASLLTSRLVCNANAPMLLRAIGRLDCCCWHGRVITMLSCDQERHLLAVSPARPRKKENLLTTVGKIVGCLSLILPLLSVLLKCVVLARYKIEEHHRPSPPQQQPPQQPQQPQPPLQEPALEIPRPLFPKLQNPLSASFFLESNSPVSGKDPSLHPLEDLQHFKLPTGEAIPVQDDDFFIPVHVLDVPSISKTLLLPVSFFKEDQATINLLCDGILLTLTVHEPAMLPSQLRQARKAIQKVEDWLKLTQDRAKAGLDIYGHLQERLAKGEEEGLHKKKQLQAEQIVFLSGAPTQTIPLLNAHGEPIQAPPSEITEHTTEAERSFYIGINKTEPRTRTLDIVIAMGGATDLSLAIAARGLIVRGYGTLSRGQSPTGQMLSQTCDHLAFIPWDNIQTTNDQDTIKSALFSAPLTLHEDPPADDDPTPVCASLKNGMFRLRIILPPIST